MRIFLLLISLLFVNQMAHAVRIKPSNILSDNKGFEFPIDGQVKMGDKIYIYSRGEDKLRLDGLAIVAKCESTCRAVLKKARKGVVLTNSQFYSTSQLRMKPKKVVTKNLQETPEVSTPPTKKSGKNHLISGSYGGPILFGMQANYMNQMSENVRAGFTLGMISSNINKVGLDGKYLALRADYKLWQLDDMGVDISPYLEAGYIQSKLDFADLGGLEIDESVPYFGTGVDIWKEWESFFLILRLGYTHNMYKASYVSDGFAFETPFDGGLFTYELGLGFKF